MVKLALFPRKGATVRRKRSGSGASQQSAGGLWDQPQLLNLAADVLMLLCAVALAYAAVISVVRLPFFPLKQLLVASALDQVSPAQIEYAAQTSLDGNFFTVNLDNVRSAFEKLPWVRKASVRRRWPDGIELTIEEHVAVARWRGSDSEARLVNSHGELFTASLSDGQTALPLFGGPEGSAAVMLARYREFAELLASLGRSSRVVTLSPRLAWQLRLDDGLTLELGRDQTKHPLHERLQRFTGIYAEVRARAKASINTIDMRYPNGFALRLGRTEALARQDMPITERKGNT
ncbi:MAG: cell division protein FtsQ/DivIB [Proteobacteria bacterium]|nr:cell division protein FtsQ/DivIB [Pseudomonadota bacterium]